MNRFSILLAAAAALSTTACQRDDRAANTELTERLEALETRVDRLEQGQARAGARPARPQRPQPGVLYAVPVHDDDAQRGPADAKVTIVEAYEYACPYCFQVAPLMDAALEAYPEDVRVVSKPFLIHPDVATLPALAACAADQQDAFARFEHALWPKAWGDQRLDREALAESALVALAEELGLDVERFTADMKGDECKGILARTRKEMAAVGVRGTPSIYVNGKPYAGQRSIDALKEVIDQEIAAADAAIAKGTAPADYYASLVAKGKKTL